MICGSDAALFVIFNRYAAILFAGISVFNALVLIPIYVTGETAHPDLMVDPETGSVITLLTITILNATGNEIKLVAVFGMILAVYSGAVYVMIFLYWKRSLAWRFKDLQPLEVFAD